MTAVTKGAFVLEGVVGLILCDCRLEERYITKVLYTVDLYDRGRVDDLDIETPRVPFGVTLVPVGRGKLGLTNETGCLEMVKDCGLGFINALWTPFASCYVACLCLEHMGAYVTFP
jgi:hypothetical protein